MAIPSIELLIAADCRSRAFLACLRCQNLTIAASTMTAIADTRRFNVWVVMARDSDMCWVAISASGHGRVAVSTYLGRLFSRNSVSAASRKACGARVQGRTSTAVSAAVRGEVSANPGARDEAGGGSAKAGVLVTRSEGTSTKTGVPAESASGSYDIVTRLGDDIDVRISPKGAGAEDSTRSGIGSSVELSFDAWFGLGT
jgi:hypothetical protein